MISDLKPDNNPNWIVKGNTIYYHHMVNIPILTLEDDIYWLIIDRRATKAFIKMMIFLLKKEIDFYFKSRFFNSKELFDEDKFHNENIKAYILLLEDENIYKMIKSGKYPYNLILIKYLKYFNCINVFSEELQSLKKELLGSYHDYYSNKKIFNIPNEEIRSMIQALDRTIKIEYVID